MALKARYLVDKSALSRLKYPEAEWVRNLILEGLVSTCSIVDLEVLYSAKNYDEFRRIKQERNEAFERVDIEQADFNRSVEVMGKLAMQGHHRAVGIPDLLIAAIAERNLLTLIHYDHDFEFVASITGQNIEWLTSPGTLT
ncbi:MAG: PIN domain nuclease [Actinobacteria bacterium]|nr:PIN domain nuclease [Actinomycetota bacterium]MCL6104201.1 PIN domain nuclease [Actinomycetota bacterium]